MATKNSAKKKPMSKNAKALPVKTGAKKAGAKKVVRKKPLAMPIFLTLFCKAFASREAVSKLWDLLAQPPFGFAFDSSSTWDDDEGWGEGLPVQSGADVRKLLSRKRVSSVKLFRAKQPTKTVTIAHSGRVYIEMDAPSLEALVAWLRISAKPLGINAGGASYVTLENKKWWSEWEADFESEGPLGTTLWQWITIVGNGSGVSPLGEVLANETQREDLLALAGTEGLERLQTFAIDDLVVMAVGDDAAVDKKNWDVYRDTVVNLEAAVESILF